MPLPPALLAKLQKRGIVKKELKDHEEVFAESYDDEEDRFFKRRAKQQEFCAGCPNKNNPYHMCVEFCFTRWADGTDESRLPERYMRLKARHLNKHPLPPGWKEVYDPGMRRHYYWNIDTDDVSWLSPSHRHAVIGESGPRCAQGTFNKIAKAQIEKLRSLTAADAVKAKRQRSPSPPSPESSDESSTDDETKDKGTKANIHKMVRKRANIDPMDPSSYGDCGAGGWGTGLMGIADANTGADTTAVGPLFQSRPLPAPGAVLRRNQQAQQKKRV